MEPEEEQDLPGMHGPWPPVEEFNSHGARLRGYVIYLLAGFNIGAIICGWMYHVFPAHAERFDEAAIGMAVAAQSVLVIRHRMNERRLRKKEGKKNV